MLKIRSCEAIFHYDIWFMDQRGHRLHIYYYRLPKKHGFMMRVSTARVVDKNRDNDEVCRCALRTSKNVSGISDYPFCALAVESGRSSSVSSRDSRNSEHDKILCASGASFYIN